jgi:Right handed beta helix region
MRAGMTLTTHADGAIVVSGMHTSVTFARVRFEGCPLIVTGGAKVALLKTTSISAEVGLYVSGNDSTLTARGAELISCRQGVVSDKGATVLLEGVRCTESTITAVEARGRGTEVRRCCARAHESHACSVYPPSHSRCACCCFARARLLPRRCAAPPHPALLRRHVNVQLTMRRCLIGETKKGRAAEWDARAVFVHSAAKAMLEECALWRSSFGLWAEGAGTEAVLSHCKVRNNVRCGVLAAGGCMLHMRHSTAVGSREFHGVEVGDDNTRAQLHGCVLQRNKRCGLVAYEGAAVAATACTAEGNSAAAFRSRDRARMVLADCSSKNDAVALAVFGARATADAKRCALEGAHSAGVRVGAGGHAELLECSIAGVHHGDGVEVADIGSKAVLGQCRISSCARAGVVVYDGGQVEASHCIAAKNGRAGFKPGHGGRMKLHECEEADVQRLSPSPPLVDTAAVVDSAAVES